MGFSVGVAYTFTISGHCEARSMCSRNPLHCIVPPYIIEHLAQSADPAVRCWAVANLAASQALRAVRSTTQAMPGLMVRPQGFDD
ncbi:hypothetical protein NVV93_12790 [Pseudomonas sp. LS44]|uniref:hypothetical protein n=1 Tax=Pseudomonas sp. LS44 TaxID=1357074 RepID=UPI00215A21A9|nr:hypothetical protein [Pseudomonas sp. LS44]UVE16488.1 hypothetical protein NVV93_12790 [Pseudomonas sp. LS44]